MENQYTCHFLSYFLKERLMQQINQQFRPKAFEHYAQIEHLISTFVHFLTVTAKVLSLEVRLQASLFFHPILR